MEGENKELNVETNENKEEKKLDINALSEKDKKKLLKTLIKIFVVLVYLVLDL